MYCLDTNVIIDLLRGDKDIILKLDSLDGNISITPITLFELFKGGDEDEYLVIENLISEFNILDFDIMISKTFGRMFKKLRKIGKMSPESDLMIASFVKAYNMTLITRDKKHFENINIKIEVW